MPQSTTSARAADDGTSATTATLARALRAGDRGAFASLYGRFARPLRALLLVQAAVRDVDDLLQESFLAAWRHRAALRDEARFAPWLFAIGRSVARAARRRWRVDGSGEGASGDGRAVQVAPEQLAAPGAEQAAQHAAERAEVLAALRALPESYRETLALRLIEGRSGPEIAELTGLTHGSVRVNLHRGMELLRERLGAAAPRARVDRAEGRSG